VDLIVGMIKQFPLQAFFRQSQEAWSQLPEHRKPNPNTKYKLSDAVNSAFSVFIMQAQSFLAHNQAMSSKKKGRNNLRTLFQVENVPSDNQIRNLLDPINPTEFAPQFEWIWEKLDELGGLKSYQTELGSKLIALDGMVYHSSKSTFCDSCSTRKDRNGDSHYYHATLLPLMVKPDFAHVLSLFPEMITPQDGHEKQDCERVAAKRWLKNWSHLFDPFSVTFLGDDLFSNQPLCQQINDLDQYFLFVCKPDSHVGLYRWLTSLTLSSDSKRIWNGKHGEIWTWRWVNDVPIREGDDALRGNWCELVITHEETGKTLYHNSWFTNHLLDKNNVASLCSCARTRWKIENEGINVLKTKGYHVEHNFGHGQQFLAQVFLVLNLLAFLLHTALELVDDLVKFLRQSLGKRTTFFADIRALCRYNSFQSWNILWLFMIEALDDDDIPPKIMALF